MNQTVIIAAGAAADAGVRGIAAVSARLAYALMCLTVCWGVLTRTGWIKRFGERRTLRSGHMVLATLTIAFGIVHAMSFLFLSQGAFGFAQLIVPAMPGSFLRHTMAIVGLELMLAIAFTASLYRWTSYRRWQIVHRMGYVAFGLLVVHSFFGAIENGHLAVTWLAGLTLLIPTVTMAILRYTPTRVLVQIGLVEEQV